MQNILYILSGISDVSLIVLIFLWGFDYARKEKLKHNHHFGLWTLATLALTVVLMFAAGAGK
ncbi:hypothetical protein [Lentilactobacillus hilgardii]|uniref:hypothetical protein n=1 Tax=Lentilactobacillus hilgardii TaxID=1588 RepID=UPI0021A81449|nr:hypothetical protein [Lentilactobacillus hilgardii]MCT3398829.1 hypothetical protein [Lentilactobacillus hilgardii]